MESGKGASCWDALRRWTWARAVRLAPRNAPTLAVVGAKPTVTDAATSNTSTIAIKMPHRIEISGSPLLDWRHGGLELSGCDSLADRTRSFSARILGLRPILVSAVREKTVAEEGVRVLERCHTVGCWKGGAVRRRSNLNPAAGPPGLTESLTGVPSWGGGAEERKT